MKRLFQNIILSGSLLISVAPIAAAISCGSSSSKSKNKKNTNINNTTTTGTTGTGSITDNSETISGINTESGNGGSDITTGGTNIDMTNVDMNDNMDLVANIITNGERNMPSPIIIPNVVQSDGTFSYNNQINESDILNKVEDGKTYKTISNGLFEWWVEENIITNSDLVDINRLFFKRGFYTGAIKRLRKVYIDEWAARKPMGMYDDNTDIIHISIPSPTTRFSNFDYWKQAIVNTLMHEYGHLITMHAIADDENDNDETVRYFNKLVQGNPSNLMVDENLPGLVAYKRNESLLRDFYMAISTGQRKIIKDQFGITVDKDTIYYTTFPWKAKDYEGSFEEMVTRELLALTSMVYTDDMARGNDAKWAYETTGDLYEWQNIFRSNLDGNFGPNFIDLSGISNTEKVAFEMNWMGAYNPFTGMSSGTFTETGNTLINFYKKLFNFNTVVNDLYVENNVLNASLWFDESKANEYDGALMFDGNNVQFSPLVKVSNTFNINRMDNYNQKRDSDWDNNITRWNKNAYHLEFNYSSGAETLYLYKDKNSDGKIQADEISQIHGGRFNRRIYRESLFGSRYTLQATESSHTLKIKQ